MASTSSSFPPLLAKERGFQEKIELSQNFAGAVFPRFVRQRVFCARVPIVLLCPQQLKKEQEGWMAAASGSSRFSCQVLNSANDQVITGSPSIGGKLVFRGVLTLL